ncbi:9588_t:CDS:2, partial [Dentiscutata erythropus]
MATEEVKLFWKVITTKKKYREQLVKINASVSIFTEKINVVTRRDVKKADDNDESISIPTKTEFSAQSEKENREYEKVEIEEEQIEFWSVKRAKLGSGNESTSTPTRTKFSARREKENGKYKKFNILSLKVIPGFKFLKNTLKTRYPDTVNEIETYEEDQKMLTSLEATLKVWLQKVLSSTTPEKLYKCLMEPLQDENNTDQDKKLHEIFELTLKEFYLMIKYNPSHILMRHNSERKFLVERVSTPFKLVEYAFGTITTYWIEKVIMSTKAAEFTDNPIGELVTKKADVLATDLAHNVDIMNMEISGGPFQQDRKHTLKVSEKISNIRVNILLTSLRKYLCTSVVTAKKLKTFNIQVIGIT